MRDGHILGDGKQKKQRVREEGRRKHGAKSWTSCIHSPTFVRMQMKNNATAAKKGAVGVTIEAG